MKRTAAVALAFAITLPACAQRGGSSGHAGFTAHGGSAGGSGFRGGYAPAHAGFTSAAPVPYAGSPYAHASVAYPSSVRVLAPGVHYPVSAPIIRPTFYHPTHPINITHSHAFIIGTYPVYPYAYYAYPSLVYGYLPADMLDDSYDNSSEQQQPAPDYSSVYPQPDYSYAYPQPAPQPDYAYAQPVPQPAYAYPYPQPVPAYPAYPQPQPVPDGAYAYPAPPPGYQAYPQPAPAAPQMQYVPGSSSSVILIYKDGRPPEEIQNYLATRTTLTVLDGGRRREIPLSDLNLPATISANHQIGVDFELPSAAH